MRPCFAAACLLLTVATPLHAGSVPQFTSAWFLGDSLTDPGNLYELTGGALPPTPPYAGTSTNGKVWAQNVAEAFEAEGLKTGNFAYSYATAVKNDDLDPDLGRPPALTVQIPDLPDQLTSLQSVSKKSLGADPLVSVWAGANDVFDAIKVADPADPTGAAQSVALAASHAAASVASTVAKLGNLGFDNVLVFNLPALEETPAYNLSFPAAAPLAKLGADTFNATLAASLGGLKNGPNIIGIDAHKTFASIIADPGKYGLKDVVTPCFDGVTVCSDDVAATSFFFDGVHPTAAGHKVISSLVMGEVSPVPLPASGWLVLAGIAVMAVLGRRRIA